jgi:uncharacterized protein DUF3846
MTIPSSYVEAIQSQRARDSFNFDEGRLNSYQGEFMTKVIDLDVDGFYVLAPHNDPIFCPQANEPTLTQLQGHVGGYIELVSIGGGKADGVVNEEGKLRGLPFNPLATALYNNPNDRIVGTMVVCCGKARLK